MGVMDAFNPEDRVEMKFSDFYRLMESAANARAKLRYIENAVNTNVPNQYIIGMMYGKLSEETDN